MSSAFEIGRSRCCAHHARYEPEGRRARTTSFGNTHAVNPRYTHGRDSRAPWATLEEARRLRAGRVRLLPGGYGLGGRGDGGLVAPDGRRLSAFVSKAAKEANADIVAIETSVRRRDSAFPGRMSSVRPSSRPAPFVELIAPLAPSRAALAVSDACRRVLGLVQGTRPGIRARRSDNRRTVDFLRCREPRGDRTGWHDRGALTRELLAPFEDGRIKLYVTTWRSGTQGTATCF